MKSIVLLAGIPGSGKSTWANSIKDQGKNVFILDSDETRRKLMGSYLIFPEHMEIIYDDMVRECNELLSSYEDVTIILDASFLDNYRRKYYLDRIVGADYKELVMCKMKDYAICYQRNHLRRQDKWVPDSVIDSMIKRYEEPSEEVLRLLDKVQVIYLD